MVKFVTHFDNFTKWTCLVVNRERCFWAPPMKTATLGHQSHHRRSWRRIQGWKVMNLHPMLLSMMQLPIFFCLFRCVLDWFRSVGSYGISNILGLVIGFGMRTALWLRGSKDAIRKKKIEYCLFLFQIFSYIIWGCTVPSFNIFPFPSKKQGD
jgi:hypothetical protein